jgi:hypothetical protein
VGNLDIVVTGGAFTANWAREVNLFATATGSVSATLRAPPPFGRSSA